MWPFTKKTPAVVEAKFDVAQTTSENRKHWANADGLSSRAAISPAVRRVVRLRSRYEAENNSWYRGMLRTAVNHIVGKGPRLQVLTPDIDFNNRIEAAWQAWSKKIGLARKLRTATEAYWRDGEVFMMRTERAANYPMTLDVSTYEADQIASPWTTPSTDKYIDDGIRVDPNTNELAVYVLDEHPGSNFGTVDAGEWYPADQVLHLFREERPKQTRGIPRVTASLQQLPIMRRQELATLFSAETAANFALYLKSNSPAISPTSSPQDFAEIEIARNMLTTLPAGWEVGQVEPKQPGPQYEGFQRQSLMSFSRCTNMPYALACGTSKDSNFSSLKGDMKNIWEPEVQVEQDEVEGRILEPIFQWFLEAAIYVPGLLDGGPQISEISHLFHWPPLPELDALVSAKAAQIRLSSGQSTFTEEYARRGHDYETQVARMAQDGGVTVEEAKRALFHKTYSLIGTPPLEGEEPEPEEVEDMQDVEAQLLQASGGEEITHFDAVSLEIKATNNDMVATDRRFHILAYSGGTLPVNGYPVPVVVDLSGLEASGSIPILIDHKNTVETSLGSTDHIENDGKQLVLAGPVTGTSDLAKSVIDQSDAKRTWQASIGARVLEAEEIKAGQTAFANGRKFVGPVIIARRSSLRETSVLSMGADSSTSVNLAAAANLKGMSEMNFDEWLQSLNLTASAMSEDDLTAMQLAFDAKSAPPVTTEPITASAAPLNIQQTVTADLQAAMAEGRQMMANQLRTTAEIQAKAAGHPMIAAKAIEEGWTVDKVELEVLKASAAKTRPTSFGSAESSPEDQPQVLEAALCLHRKHSDVEDRFSDQILQAAHTQYKGRIGLQQIFLQAAANSGMPLGAGTRIHAGNLREVLAYACPNDPRDIQASASTLSLPGILSNVANKEILMGWEEEDAIWREIAVIKSVSDFKQVSSYRLLDDMEYEELGADGRIKHGSVGEESYTRQAGTYAKMFALTRAAIINDDMSALDDLRNRVGRGGAKKLNNLFWTTFLDNSTFYTAARTNYISGSTTNLGADGVGLGKGVEAYRKRKSSATDGAKRLGGTPSKLLVPPELEVAANQLYIATNATAVKGSDVNTHANKYRPIVANQLSDAGFTGNSATAWYLLGGSSMDAPVAVSFLNGQETPTVETADADFSTLGVQFRGYHDFGCDKAEYLGSVKSKGAA